MTNVVTSRRIHGCGGVYGIPRLPRMRSIPSPVCAAAILLSIRPLTRESPTALLALWE